MALPEIPLNAQGEVDLVWLEEVGLVQADFLARVLQDPDTRSRVLAGVNCGPTLAHWAVEKEERIAERALEDPQIALMRDEIGRTVAHEALRCWPKLGEKALEKGDILFLSLSDDFGFTIADSMVRGSEDLAWKSLQKPEIAQIPHAFQSTLAHHALWSHESVALRTLEEAHRDLAQRLSSLVDEHGRTPFHSAAERWESFGVRVLAVPEIAGLMGGRPEAVAHTAVGNHWRAGLFLFDTQSARSVFEEVALREMPALREGTSIERVLVERERCVTQYLRRVEQAKHQVAQLEDQSGLLVAQRAVRSSELAAKRSFSAPEAEHWTDRTGRSVWHDAVHASLGATRDLEHDPSLRVVRASTPEGWSVGHELVRLYPQWGMRALERSDLAGIATESGWTVLHEAAQSSLSVARALTPQIPEAQWADERGVRVSQVAAECIEVSERKTAQRRVR